MEAKEAWSAPLAHTTRSPAVDVAVAGAAADVAVDGSAGVSIAVAVSP